MPEENKQDMIDRKGAWIERMFDRLFSAIQKDVKGTFLIIAVAVILWQQSIISNSNDLRIADRDKFTADMINEVRNTVKHELPKQLAPIQAKQDSINTAVGRNMDTALNNLDGTVEKVKQYINKKTR